MRTITNLSLKPLSIAVLTTLTLTACSNPSVLTDVSNNQDNTSKDNTSQPQNPASSPATTDNTPKSEAQLQQERIEHALATGDATVLQPQDTSVLLQQAIDLANAQVSGQQSLLTSILTDDSGNPLDQTFQFVNSASIRIIPQDSMTTMPLVQSDTGLSMAAISVADGGRGLAYGANVLASIAAQSGYVAHTPIFNNAMRWIATGNAKTNPTALTVATVGYDSNVVKNYFKKQLGVDVTVSSCDILNNTDNCQQNVDVVFFGTNIPQTSATTDRVKALMKAGKGVVFMGNNRWDAGDAARTVINGMGMTDSGYGGNYSQSASALSVQSSRTLAQSLNIANRISGDINIIDALNALKTESLPATNLTNDHAWIKAITSMSQYLQTLNEMGKSPFDNTTDFNDQKFWRLLVLIADNYRVSVNYNKTLTPTSNTSEFLKNYASDSWLDFKRQSVTKLPNGAGDYMPATAADIPVSQDWETITVTIPQASGNTLIGRASIPSQPVEIEVVPDTNNTKATLKIQTDYLHSVGSPFNGYEHPKRPQSYSLPISSTASVLNSPFGGPLVLNFSNATPNTTITLRIKGSAKYAHYDFSKDISQAEIDEATQALQSKKFGWNTFKFTGGEIQQTTDMALKAIGSTTPQAYVENIKVNVFDSNHIANGYNNMPLTDISKQYCNTNGWDCTSNIHKPPSTQHFVGWIAACGFLCSGNPSDAFTGVDSGWGWVHELGHNTVQRVLNLTFKSSETGKIIGCATECDNNHLAGLSTLRKYALYGIDDTGHEFGYSQIYEQINNARKTGVTGEALRQAVEKNIWNGDGYINNDGKRAFAMQQAFAFSRLYLNQAKPDVNSTFEYFRLLNIGTRLVSNLDFAKATASDKAKLGVGAFSKSGDISNIDLNYILTSKIIGYDMKNVYLAYGLPISDTAHQSVAMLNLPVAPLNFYALAVGKAHHLSEGQWVDNLPMTGELPAYPF